MRKFSVIILTFLIINPGTAEVANNNDSITFFTRQKAPVQRASLPVTKHHLVVIAHRGSHINVPENTLAAYENAIKEGADYIEIDLRTTKDGRLVIMHDESIFKMTGKKGNIKELSYDEIKDLEIRSSNKKDTATYHIPDFANVLNLCKGKINIYLDFKDADAEKTYKQIKEAKMENNVVVYLNKKEQYLQWKNVAPNVPLMASLPENMDNLQLNNFLDSVHLNVVDNANTTERLSLVHKRKIVVWLDVQSRDEGPAKWDNALKKGVDGLQTDHPEKLIQYLKERGIR